MTQLTNSDEITSVIEELVRSKKNVAVDLETTGTNPRTDRIISIQFAVEGEAWWIDVRYQPAASLYLLRPLFCGDNLLIGHNIKFDLGFLYEKLGLVAHHVYDTLIAEQIILGLGMSEAKKYGVSFGLKALAHNYGAGELEKETREYYIHLDQRPEWNEPLPADVVEYGINDVLVLHPIYSAQQALLEKKQLLETVELDMGALLAQVGMELAGVPVNKDGWRETIQRTEQEAQRLEQELLEVFGPHILAARTEEFDAEFAVWDKWAKSKQAYLDQLKGAWTGTTGWGVYKQAEMAIWLEANGQPKKPKMNHEVPNISSSKQLIQALNHMLLKSQGKVLSFESASEKALQPYAGQFEVIEKLLEWRKMNKLVVAFGEKLLEKVGEDGRLYPSYHLIGAGTGRMSSFNPNFQQIPSRGVGAELRHHIAPGEGKKLLVCDFSNIELRILAEIAKDKRLLEAFASGEDVHSVMARMIFGLPESLNPKEELAVVNGKTLAATYRAIAKTVTYAIIYGSGPAKLASVIKGSIEDAKGIIEKYLNMFTGIRAFKDAQAEKVANALRLGKRIIYSKTVGGRKRYYKLPFQPAPLKKNASQADYDKYDEAMRVYRGLLSGIRRKMVNSPIQGTSADITKWAMGEWFRLAEYHNAYRLIAVVHDEFIIEVLPDFEEAAKADLERVMEEAMKVYLHKVSTPRPEAVLSDHWEH